jgi:hypothetical protein
VWAFEDSEASDRVFVAFLLDSSAFGLSVQAYSEHSMSSQSQTTNMDRQGGRSGLVTRCPLATVFYAYGYPANLGRYSG